MPADGDGTSPGHYLLDVGDGASSLLARHGFDHRAIQVIAISHMHADHHGGLVQVIKTSMHLKRDTELIILAPSEGIEAFQAYLRASYLYPDWLGYPIRWLSLAEIAAGDGIDLPGEVRLHAYHNEHLATARDRFALSGPPPQPHTFESYSLSLERRGTRIVYSGNLLGPGGADEMIAFVEPADLLICEFAHLDAARLGQFLAGKQIRQTALTHISPKWQGVPETEILDQVRSAAGPNAIHGELLLVRDGDLCLVTGRD
jgi:ribonuclease BN (tRNA processing enzyme)